MKQFLATLLGVSALAAAMIAPTAAQEDTNQWSAYLFSSFDKQLVRVYLDGTSETYDLGLPEDTFISGRNMAFSDDGSNVAFCAPTMDGETQLQTLYVRDLSAAATLLEMDLGPAWDCRVDQESLDEESGQLAVSMLTQDSWNIHVVSLTDGEIMHSLGSGDENAPALGAEFGDMFTMPDVNHFEDGNVIFALMPYGTEGPDETAAYSWTLESGEITEVELWGKVMRDLLASTGELAALNVNEDLDAGEPGGPMPSYNEVLVAHEENSSVVLYSSEELPIELSFIENGRRLAIKLLEPFNMENPDNIQTTRWIALDREGNVVDLATPSSFSQLDMAPDGFVLLEAIAKDATSSFYDMRLSYGSDSEMSELWYLETPEEAGGIFWELAWTAPVETAEDLAPFAEMSE